LITDGKPGKRELWAVAACAAVISIAAFAYFASTHQLLLYGDAVAHLHIARRVFDTRTPALTQLGSVWLPLPHVLLLPFVQVTSWWRTGLAGAIPSMICFVAAVVGAYRLGRFWLAPEWAAVGAAALALNPGLLYMQTTAMTEPLFLALFIGLVAALIGCVQAVDEQRFKTASWNLILAGSLLAAAVLTRYDGWILAFLAGVLLLVLRGRKILLGPARLRIAAGIFTVLVLAAPLWWLWYNARYFHDPLDFMRGPYSARAIEARTTPAGAPHYPGYHNPPVAWLYYLRVSELGAGIGRIGQVWLALAVAGSAIALASRRKAQSAMLMLLWMPLPFYVYSVSYGSVPIFFPLWSPYSYYNTRYGMEMLPALTLFPAFAFSWIASRWGRQRLVFAAASLAIVANSIALAISTPLVLQEARANSATRIPFEQQLGAALARIPPGASVLMYTSANAGALQRAGMPLRQTINESDYYLWRDALADPAGHVQYVVAADHDPVAEAVDQHPAGLVPIATITSEGQPTAIVYRSSNTTAP
jgi:hypothetical protein